MGRLPGPRWWVRALVATLLALACCWVLWAQVWGEQMLYRSLAAEIDDFCGHRFVLETRSELPRGNSLVKLLRALREEGIEVRPDLGDLCERCHPWDQEPVEDCLYVGVRLLGGLVASATVRSAAAYTGRGYLGGSAFAGWYVFTPFGWVTVQERRWRG